MSSKSRKQPRKPAEDPSSKVAPGDPAKGAAALDIPDEYLKAPRKMSKVTYAFLIFFLIFALVAYVGGGFSSLRALSGEHENDRELVTWVRPGHGREAIGAKEFQTFYAGLQQAHEIDPYLTGRLGVAGRNLENEEVARILILSRLATDSGIEITDADLAEHLKLLIQYQFQNSFELYQAIAERQGGVPAVEATLRRELQALRFLDLVAFAGAVPSAEDVEKLWHRIHEERAFDYVVVQASDLADAARAELPDDAALEKWLGEQSAKERAAFELPEKRGIDVAFYRDAATTSAAGLLQAFPPKADADPEQRAHDYYDRVFSRRFTRPAPEGGADPSGLPSYKPFDEVREVCLAEAPIYEALQAWLADLDARKAAGTSIELAAEAEKHGLGFASLPPMTRAELETPELGGKAVVDAAFTTAPESFAYAIVLTPVLSVLRVRERTAPSLPAFAEIREKVAERWVELRAQALAKEKLAKLQEAFEAFEPATDEFMGPRPQGVYRRADEAAFRGAVEAAGLEVQRRDYLDRAARPGTDPEEKAPAHEFIAQHPQFATLQADEVAEPAETTEGERVYLVRLAGVRAVGMEAMNPGEYTFLKEQAHSLVQEDLRRSFDLGYMQREFDLKLGFEKREKKSLPEPAEAGEPAKSG